MEREGKWFRVESVSFPRSGHGFTVKLLEAYFGSEFRYQPNNPNDGTFSPGYHFQKNHDMDLDYPITDDRKYLVQVRDPFDAIYSWHRMTAELDGIPNTRDERMRIMDEKLDYFAGFVRKWVVPNIPNRLIINYRDLVEFPDECLVDMARLFGDIGNLAQAQRAVHKVGVLPRRAPPFFL